MEDTYKAALEAIAKIDDATPVAVIRAMANIALRKVAVEALMAEHDKPPFRTNP